MKDAKDSSLWRVSWSLQLIAVLITTIGWLFVYKNEPLKFLIARAEELGDQSKFYKEARRVLRENYNLEGNEKAVNEKYEEVCQKIKETAGNQEKPGYWRAISDP